MRRRVLQKKIAERWPEKIVAEQRYRAFAEPALKSLRILAKRLTRDPGLANDLVQEAVIKIIANSGYWKPEGGRTKKSYAEMIGSRQMRDLAASERLKRGKLFDDVASDFLSMIPSKLEPKPYAKLTAASEEAIRASVKKFLNRAVLPEKDKIIFAFYAGLEDGTVKSYKETAEHFGIPMGTVKSTIFSARKAFKESVRRKAD